MAEGSPKPKCQRCHEAEAVVWCCAHQRAFCAPCSRLHHGPECVWVAAPPLALMRSPQLAFNWADGQLGRS